VDVKPLYSDLSNTSAFAKAFKTAQHSGAQYLVISNGVEWVVFSLGDQVTLAMSIDIRLETAASRLAMLTRDAVENSVLQNYLQENQVQDLSVKEIPKNRGYKISDSTHNTLNQLRSKIVANRTVKDQEISNSLIVESLLKVFLDSMEVLNYHDISNEVILKKRIVESLKKFYQ
jgi:predicted type IV restriction endonuclease